MTTNRQTKLGLIIIGNVILVLGFAVSAEAQRYPEWIDRDIRQEKIDKEKRDKMSPAERNAADRQQQERTERFQREYQERRDQMVRERQQQQQREEKSRQDMAKFRDFDRRQTDQIEREKQQRQQRDNSMPTWVRRDIEEEQRQQRVREQRSVQPRTENNRLNAPVRTQAQQPSPRVIVRPDGLDIRLSDQARWNAAVSRPGVVSIAQEVINELERRCSGCYKVDRTRLAYEIWRHAAASYVPNGWVQRHANPINVTWPELVPTDWRAVNRGLRGIRNGVRP